MIEVFFFHLKIFETLLQCSCSTRFSWKQRFFIRHNKIGFSSSLYFFPSLTSFLLILCCMFFAWTFTIRFWIHGKSIEAFKTACVNLRVQIILSARRACSLAIYQPKLHRTTFIRPPKKRCSMTENKYKKVYRNDFILLSTNEKSETN